MWLSKASRFCQRPSIAAFLGAKVDYMEPHLKHTKQRLQKQGHQRVGAYIARPGRENIL